MFRIQPAGEKPLNISSVGAPPNGSPKAQRLNEAGQTVLYLSDSPATAFAERGALPGECCLCEWTTTAEKLLMVNGGIPPEAMLQFFRQNISEGRDPFPLTPKDEQILSFLREIYTLDADSDRLLLCASGARRLHSQKEWRGQDFGCAHRSGSRGADGGQDSH